MSLLFLYGTCGFFWAREAITSPKAERDLLICCASFSLSPVTSDLSTLSLPARSTRCIQPRRMVSDVKSLPWTCTVKQLPPHKLELIAVKDSLTYAQRDKERRVSYLWERLLRSLSAVAPTARFLCPRFIRSITSDVDDTETRFASGTLSPVWELFRISNVLMVKKNLQLGEWTINQ